MFIENMDTAAFIFYPLTDDDYFDVIILYSISDYYVKRKVVINKKVFSYLQETSFLVDQMFHFPACLIYS